jgi:hypothetical protein
MLSLTQVIKLSLVGMQQQQYRQQSRHQQQWKLATAVTQPTAVMPATEATTAVTVTPAKAGTETTVCRGHHEEKRRQQ